MLSLWCSSPVQERTRGIRPRINRGYASQVEGDAYQVEQEVTSLHHEPFKAATNDNEKLTTLQLRQQEYMQEPLVHPTKGDPIPE